MFVALVAVATMVIHVPVPATQGFVNVGDTAIFIAAVLLGPKTALIAGGLGSALADVLLGYSQWAPWTLVIKGLEGLIVGLIAHEGFRRKSRISTVTMGATVLGSVWMVGGYFVAASAMYGFAGALAGIPGDIVQGASSVVFTLVALYALQHTPITRLVYAGNSASSSSQH
jgi:uncharacterized membrane protein